MKRDTHGMSNGLSFIKRKYPRIQVRGLSGDIAYGNRVIGGYLEDISSNGFKMTDLPRNFSGGDQGYTAVVSGKGMHYRMVVASCWTRGVDNGFTVDAGFKIIEGPWEWAEFVLSLSSVDTSGSDS